MNNIPPRELKELKEAGKYTKENIIKLNNDYPIQYLIGYVDFYGLKILVNENVLIPRYETEYLIEKLLKYINKYNFTNPNILDLCTGSGCIGLTLKSLIPNSNVTMSDISKSALETAKLNSDNLNLNVKLIESDLFDNITDKYDIIVSNPPYVSEEEILPKNVLYEPKIALYSGAKGINHIERILSNIDNYINKKSIIAFEINETSEVLLTQILNKYLKNIKYSFEKDLCSKTRYLFIFKNCE